MKNYKNMQAIVLSIIALSITSCTVADPGETTDASLQQKDWNYDFHYGSDYWKYYDFSNSVVSTQENYEALVAAYIPQIENLLGAEDWYTSYDADADTILINLEMGGTPHSMVNTPTKGTNGTIEFSILLSLDRLQMPADRELSHELTHSVLGVSCFSNSLEEGICDYTAARIGVNYSDFFEEYNIDNMDFFTYDVKLALEKYYDENKSNEMLDSIGRAGGYTYSIQTRDGTVWYECSQCFVEYLVDNCGMEKTMRLIRYGNDETDYQTYLGISYDELKLQWISYISNYKPLRTKEEYMQMADEFYQSISE